MGGGFSNGNNQSNRSTSNPAARSNHVREVSSGMPILSDPSRLPHVRKSVSVSRILNYLKSMILRSHGAGLLIMTSIDILKQVGLI